MASFKFCYITDERWGETRDDLVKRDATLKSKITELGEHYSLIEASGIRELNWSDNKKQWRKDYIIKKDRGYLTWHEVKEAINSVYAPKYERV